MNYRCRYINKSEVRARALALADRKWPGKFTRVSREFLNRINDQVELVLQREISQHPTLGRTLK